MKVTERTTDEVKERGDEPILEGEVIELEEKGKESDLTRSDGKDEALEGEAALDAKWRAKNTRRSQELARREKELTERLAGFEERLAKVDELLARLDAEDAQASDEDLDEGLPDAVRLIDERIERRLNAERAELAAAQMRAEAAALDARLEEYCEAEGLDADEVYEVLDELMDFRMRGLPSRESFERALKRIRPLFSEKKPKEVAGARPRAAVTRTKSEGVVVETGGGG